jgi:regulator of extracellular matrix RemA (YlzA/DUF370 family)
MKNFKFVNIGFSRIVAMHQIRTVSDAEAALVFSVDRMG